MSTLAIETWFALGIVGLIVGVFSAYAVRTAVAGRKPDPRVVKEGGSVLLGTFTMEAFYWSFRKVGEALAKTPLTPDMLTWTSLLITLCAIPTAAIGELGIAGVLMMAGSVFDSFDGIVARQKNLGSDSGEVLDAVVDRYCDAAPLIGLTLYYHDSFYTMAVPLLAMVGSMMVSYVRAKAESMNIKLPPTLMRRHERIAYIIVALVVGPWLSKYLGEPYGIPNVGTLAIIGFVALLANYAGVRLTINLRAALVAEGRGPPGGKK